MIPVACLTVIVLGLILFLYAQQRAHQQAEAAWTAERRELVTRIQAPERIPVDASAAFVVPEREPDEWNKVGTVEIDDQYGLEDD